MNNLQQLHEQKVFEAYLYEAANGRQDIIEAALEIKEALDEYEKVLVEYDLIGEGFLSEMYGENISEALGDPKVMNELPTRKISSLFRYAAQISQGQESKEGMFSKLGRKGREAKEALQNVIKKIQAAGEKLQNTEPVQQFDMFISDQIGKAKQKLGPDSKVVKSFQEIGKYGKENPMKTAFIVAALTAASGVLLGPLGGAIAGPVIRATLGIAKGEKASSVLAKSAAFGALGAGIGEITDFIQGDEATQQGEAAAEQKGIPPAEDADPKLSQSNYENINLKDGFSSTSPGMGDENWKKFVDAFYNGDSARAERSLLHYESGPSKRLLANRLARLGIDLAGETGAEAGAEASGQAGGIAATGGEEYAGQPEGGQLTTQSGKEITAQQARWSETVGQMKGLSPDNIERLKDIVASGENPTLIQKVPLSPSEWAEMEKAIGGTHQDFTNNNDMGGWLTKTSQWLQDKGLRKPSK